MSDLQVHQAEAPHEEAAGFVSPPRLSGYTYLGPEARAARDHNRILSLWLETSGVCNLRCKYCVRGRDRGEADVTLLKELAVQAQGMGCRSIIFSGNSGEPLMFSGLREMVAYVDSLRMIPVVVTNAVFAFKDIAEFLYAHNASVIVKCDSLRAEIQDALAGEAGTFLLMRQGLENLIDAGFTAAHGTRRLGATFTVTGSNISEAEDFWRFCRGNGIFPLVKMMGEGTQRLGILPQDIMRLKIRLYSLDREEYGYSWNAFSPLPGSACMRYLSSMYVTLAGNVRPCPRTALEEHADFCKEGAYPLNVARKSLSEIYYSGPMYYCRHIDSFLGGKCRDCVYIDQCLGCRGNAYVDGVRSGMGPLHALAAECKYCFK